VTRMGLASSITDAQDNPGAKWPPQVTAGGSPILSGSGEAHGLAVTTDQKTMVACSRLNNALTRCSLI
jgi:hypothetical protein